MTEILATQEAETSVVRVFLLDDTRELRQRVRRALSESADLDVVGEADDPVDGLPLIVDLQPDVVICDLSMPRMDGLEAIPHIARSAPDAGIVIFSGFLGEALGATALSLGADRYVEKSAPLSELEATVRAVAADRRAGVRPEPVTLPVDTARAVPRPQARVREDRPLEDVVAEAREIPLLPVYLIGLASLALAATLTISTELAPATFLLLWLAPTFVVGALAPAWAGTVSVLLASGLWAYCSHKLGNPTWYLAAGGVLITQGALAYGANRVVGWMQRRVDRQEALTEDLRRSNAELEHFAYVASHDLAAPLRSVNSFTTLLARRYEGRLDDEADRMIGYITAGTKRMQRMIDDLLAFARAGRVESEVGPFQLSAVLEQVRSDLAGEIAERGAEIRAGALPQVVGDAPRIGQVVQNLVANAIKFCPPDRAPEVDISASRLPSGWRIDVKDNGIGIDPRYASKVFGMFQRLHGDDDFPGTGIGLAICQRIVERHGGHIWVDGFEGAGSTFSFTIPDPEQ